MVLVGAVLLLVGTFTYAFWTASDKHGSGGLGLHGVKFCSDKEGCQTIAYDGLVDQEHVTTRIKVFVMAGNVGYWGAFLTAALALLAAGSVFGNAKLPFSPGRIAMALGGLMFVTAIAFVVLRPSDKGDDALSLGYGLFVYVIGAIGVAVGGFMAAKEAGLAPPPAEPPPA